jgi:DNA-directed RNA polymerase specialized sigma24 family protein
MTDVSPADRDDAALLAASAAGDEDAFAAFYRRHLAAITGFHLRRTGRREIAFVIDDEDLVRVDELASRGDESRLAELLAELPAEQREAITARVVDERPYEEIAASLRCSEAVVRQRVHRGLRRLRQRLEETA